MPKSNNENNYMTTTKYIVGYMVKLKAKYERQKIKPCRYRIVRTTFFGNYCNFSNL